ncbi:MAG: trypsin-like peptidase domain-containing protein [Verrucomicrobiia bacterium]
MRISRLGCFWPLSDAGKRVRGPVFSALALVLAAWPVWGGAAKAPETDVRRDSAVIAVEKVLPSIVNISTDVEVTLPSAGPMEELFQEFFGPYYRRRPPNAQRSLGSGVIITEDGYILTNFHVVRRATRITVTLIDGREFEARFLSRTAKSDVALLKIVTRGEEKFEAARFAPDDDLLLGETVLALGNPFGLGVSVSRGILSSKTRRPPVENEPLDMQDWLQTDAAINPGNSGGPLVNLRGELIGLNVAVFREGQGIGFAVPVKRISEALTEIFTPEAVHSLWFGGRFETRAHGVVAVSVEAGSPAERAGLRAADRVTSANGRTVRTAVELSRELLAAASAREVRLEVQRQDDRRTLRIRMIPERDVFNSDLIAEKLGVAVEDLPTEVAARMSLPAGEGLLITSVEKNSPAARANLARGYVIRTLDGQVLETVKQAARMLYAREPGAKVQLDLVASRVRGNFLQIFPARVELKLR